MTAVSAWDDPALTNALGDRLADDLRDMVRAFEAEAHRSQQTAIGPSEVGNPCTRCLARHALGMRVTRDYDDPWCRILGTAGHTWLDEAAEAWNVRNNRGRLIADLHVNPHPDLIPAGGRLDLYDEETHTVVDHKIVGTDQLRKYRLSGPGPRYRTQVHVYGLGQSRTGKKVEHVAVAFWPRGGRLSDLHVWTEPYQPDVAMTALKRWETIRDQALAIGPGILPHLPADPSCWDCGGKDVSPDELTPAPTQPNPAPRKEPTHA